LEQYRGTHTHLAGFSGAVRLTGVKRIALSLGHAN
jgi:hypothetical protein